MDDLHWLVAQGGFGQFLEARDRTYHDLTLKFLSTLHVEVISVPYYQEGYISFYLNRKVYELNLDTFNSIFGFSPSLDLPIAMLLKNLVIILFEGAITETYQYDTSHSKGTIIRYPCIRVA